MVYKFSCKFILLVVYQSGIVSLECFVFGSVFPDIDILLGIALLLKLHGCKKSPYIFTFHCLSYANDFAL